MKNYFLILLILIIISCQSKTKSEKTVETVLPEKKNRTETKVFGDSLKIVYEYKGDTVIQKRIDLKGTSDDNFDSSFNVISVWSTRMASELDCNQNFKLNQDDVEFNFCFNDIITKIENDIIKYSDKPWRIDRLKKLKKELLSIKNGKSEKLTQRTSYYLIFNLIREINFSAYDNKTKSNTEKIRIEKYETNFSGGRNYYLINKENDTIARFDVNEWIS
jgi:hypothetical protein